MHKIRHSSTIRALSKTSFFLITTFISSIVFLTLLAWMFFTSQFNLLIPIEISGGLVIVFGFLKVTSTRHCRCQLCQAPLMSLSKCIRSKKAKRLFGSYQLHLASSILLTKQFNCSYCGERFNCEVPPEPTHKSPDGQLRHTVSVRRMGALQIKRS